VAVRSLRGLKDVIPVGSIRIDRKSRWGNPFKMDCEAELYPEWVAL